MILVLLLIALCVAVYGYLYSSKIMPKKVPDLEIGGRYVLQGDNPFNSTTVVILDIRNDWVQYHFVYNGVPGVHPVTMTVENFSNIYERIDNAIDT